MPNIQSAPESLAIVDKTNVLFTFPSGAFAYDCQKCGSQCCRGYGYRVQVQDVRYQLERRPYLRFFVNYEHEPFVSNCPPGCFFLREDGLCDIETADGYDAKPETCRLFPFNNIRRAGQYLIVSAHETLCPLRLVPATEHSVHSCHKTLLEQMQKGGLRNEIPQAALLGNALADTFEIERKIVEASQDFRNSDFLAFAKFQQLVSFQSEAFRESSLPMPIEQLQLSIAEMLGFDSALLKPGEDIDDLLVAMTSSIRSRILFSRADGSGIQIHANTYLPQLPAYLLGLRVLAHAARLAGMSILTYQSLSRIATTFHDLLTLVSLTNVQVCWRRDALIDLEIVGPSEYATAFAKIASALTLKHQRRNGLTLGEILKHSSVWSEFRNLQFLKTITPKLVGRLRRIDEPELDSDRATVRSRLQQWSVAGMS